MSAPKSHLPSRALARLGYHQTTRIITVLAGLLSYVPIGIFAFGTGIDDIQEYCRNRPPAGDHSDGYGDGSWFPLGVECTYEVTTSGSTQPALVHIWHDFGTIPLVLSGVLLIAFLILTLTWRRRLSPDNRPRSERLWAWFLTVGAATPWTLLLLLQALLHQPPYAG